MNNDTGQLRHDLINHIAAIKALVELVQKELGNKGGNAQDLFERIGKRIKALTEKINEI